MLSRYFSTIHCMLSLFIIYIFVYYSGLLLLLLMYVCDCSLHSNSAVDINVKSRLIKDLLNLAGFVLPNKEHVVPGPQPPTDWR